MPVMIICEGFSTPGARVCLDMQVVLRAVEQVAMVGYQPLDLGVRKPQVENQVALWEPHDVLVRFFYFRFKN